MCFFVNLFFPINLFFLVNFLHEAALRNGLDASSQIVHNEWH